MTDTFKVYSSYSDLLDQTEIRSSCPIVLDAIAQSGQLTEMSENSFVETVQLTTTETTQPVQHDSGQNHKGYLHYFRDVDPIPDQGLHEVLTRKYRLGNFTWSSTAAVGTSVNSTTFPQALLVAAPNLTEKINRFHYFRSEVELEFQIAGTMFHKGALMAAILPFTKSPLDMKLDSIYAMSTCDHVMISPGTNTTVKLRIPYRSITTHWEHTMGNDEGYFGVLQVRVAVPLSQLNAQSPVTLNVAVFARFVNPEVMAPTLHAVLAQSDLQIKSDAGVNQLNNVLDKVEKQTDKEANRKGKTGIVSKVLEAASGVTSFLALTPLGGPISAAVSTGFGILGNIARKWGYDKPNSIMAYQPIYMSTANMLANGNGMNTQAVLGLDYENKMSRNPEDFGSNVDETSLQYLYSLPGLFKKGSFDSSDIAGTIIDGWANEPMLYYDEDDSTIQLLPCSTLASFFKYWRGDMKYHIRFYGNKFTCCKVRISWGVNEAESLLTPEGEGDFPSTVIEVMGDTVFSFSVPFISNLPYCTRRGFKFPVASSDHAGYIRLSIVNPTAALQTETDTTVDYMIWASCGENFDFQAPFPNNLLTTGLLAYDTIYLYTSPGTLAQADVTDDNNIRSVFLHEFPPLFVSRRTMMVKVNTGEHIRSLLTLAHRFQHVDSISIDTDMTRFYDMPDQLGNGNYAPILFNLLRYWFMYFRGSLSYKLIPSETTGSLNAMIMVENANELTSNIEMTQRHGINGVSLEILPFKPAVEFTVPFYSQYPFRWRPWNYPTEFRGIMPKNRNGFSYHLHSYDTETTAIGCDVFMAISDDAQFGYPAGCPKLRFFNFFENSSKEVKKHRVATHSRAKEHFSNDNNNNRLKSSTKHEI